jgi:hypothetical protein
LERRKTAGIGQQIKGRKVVFQFLLKRFYWPLGQDWDSVNGLCACGVIIQDDDLTLGVFYLFLDLCPQLNGPFNRKATHAVFELDTAPVSTF